MANKQLELLVRVQKDREGKLETQFVQALQFFNRAEQKYQGLADYRTDYIVQSQQQGAAGLESRQYSQFIRFIAKLDQALVQQAQEIQQAQSVVQQRREKWLAMQKKRKAIEYLLDRQMLEQAEKAARQEQLLLDEVATQQFLRRQLLP